MAADDTDLLAAELAEELLANDPAVPARDDYVPPDHTPQKTTRDGWWPRLNAGGQQAIFESEALYISSVGPKGAAKTIGHLHRLVRHCYENQNALAIIMGTGTRMASLGAGYDLVDLVLPTWRDGNREPAMIKQNGLWVPNPRDGQLIDEGIGLEFTQWKLDPVTKDRHLWIANSLGGWSQVLLISIQHEAEVQKKLFSIQPSMVYVEELMNCGGRDYFAVPVAQLGRRRNIRGPQQWMSSQNTESPDHWTYKLLYEECVVTTGGRAWPNDPHKPGIMRDPRWDVHYLWFEENAHNMPSGYREQLLTAYKSDDTKKRRMLDAEWIPYPSGEAIFKDHYSEDKFVYGSVEKKRGILPIKGYPIIIGYDPGTANPSISLEQLIDTRDEGTAAILFDELVYTSEHVNYYRLTKLLMEKMAYWQRRCEYVFEFRFIADDQATTQRNPEKGSTTARSIEDYSRQIKEADPERYANVPIIRFIGCPKPPESVEMRVNMMADAMLENRLFVSATCTRHRQMFLHLERDKEKPSTPKKTKAGHIHVFDSASYPMFFRRFVLKKGFREQGNVKAVEVSV